MPSGSIFLCGPPVVDALVAVSADFGDESVVEDGKFTLRESFS